MENQKMSEQNCYGDGIVFEGVRSMDSVIPTLELPDALLRRIYEEVGDGKARELLERAMNALDGGLLYRLNLQEEIRAYLAEPEVKREALSDGEINKGWWAGPDFIDLGAFSLGVRFSEKHHGIGREE